MIHINDHLTSMNFSRCCLMLRYFFCVLVCVILFEFLVSTCHILSLPFEITANTEVNIRPDFCGQRRH